LFIEEGMTQPERLVKLNQIARHQMKILMADNSIKKLEGK